MVDLLSRASYALRRAGAGVAALWLAAMLLAIGAPGCGAFRKDKGAEPRAGAPPQRTEATRAGRTAERAEAGGRGERRTPSRADAGADSPKRLASQKLVEEGKGYWVAGLDEQARERFGQAIRLDGSNGTPYYYLAEIAADAGEWADAAGYHERASALLRGREEYRQPLAELAGRIAERR